MPPPHEARYPARLPDGRILFLPIRPLDKTGLGIASLILNQCSFEVESTLTDFLTDRLKSTGPDVIVGMPTLGLSFARAVAERLPFDFQAPNRLAFQIEHSIGEVICTDGG